MHPYPPYNSLVLVAEQCPLSMEVLLGLYRHQQETNSNMLTFDVDLTDEVHQVGWVDFVEQLNQLEMWDVIKYEFTAKDKLEVTLPSPDINAAGKAIC